MPGEEEKLIMLGLKRQTNQADDAGNLTSILKDAFGEDYADFKDEYEDDDPGDFDAFESFLTDNDVDDGDAESVRNTFEDRYEEFDEFDDDVRSYESYTELSNAFGSGNQLRSDVEDGDGNPAAGVKVYDSAGVGKNGQSIPEGGVEIYGEEIHFSQTGADPDDEPPGTGEEGDETTFKFEYSDLEVSETLPSTNEIVTVSCTVSNPSNRSRGETVQFYIDDEGYDSEFVSLGPVDSKTVEFLWSSAEYVSVEAAIGPLDPEMITVTHPGLI